MSETIINPTDLLLNVSYKVIAYQRLRDSCDWYYLLKIVKVLNESEEFILRINNNHCYIHDKVKKIISGEIEVSRLVISRCAHPVTGEVKLYCNGDAAWIPLLVE